MANSEQAKLDKEFPWYGFSLGKQRYGVEHSLIEVKGVKYLERWILYAFGMSFRAHKFWRGDDDRAPHDHPFWFVTFPFKDYDEVVPEGSVLIHRTVKAFRFHFRPAEFQHIVLGAKDGKPFWTFCISKYVGRKWGFWPSPTTFVYWRDWT